jgi:hypothetical protein
MAAQQKERSAKTAVRQKARGEEEIRLHCMAGTRQALAELMVWSGIKEEGEAITLMSHHLHAPGPNGALPLLEPPRHEITDCGTEASKLKDRESRFHMYGAE